MQIQWNFCHFCCYLLMLRFLLYLKFSEYMFLNIYKIHRFLWNIYSPTTFICSSWMFYIYVSYVIWLYPLNVGHVNFHTLDWSEVFIYWSCFDSSKQKSKYYVERRLTKFVNISSLLKNRNEIKCHILMGTNRKWTNFVNKINVWWDIMSQFWNWYLMA